MNPKKLFIKDPIRGKRFVGTLSKRLSGLVFRKDVDSTKHLLRVAGNSYGIQKVTFDKFLRGKKGVIQIKEKDTGKFLVASIKTWTEHSRTANYGDGRQVFLARRFFHNSNDFNRETTEERPATMKEYAKNMRRLASIWKQKYGGAI